MEPNISGSITCPNMFYSDWHGYYFKVYYWPKYGVVAPEACTSNGDPFHVRQFLFDKDQIIFDKWVIDVLPEKQKQLYKVKLGEIR